MKKILNIIVSIFFLFLGVFISGVVFAITWPNTPTWEFLRWGFIAYLDISLVNTWATTDWIVKKALDTDNLWNWVIISSWWNIWIANSFPTSKFDVNWKTISQNFQLISWMGTWNILVSDSSWNWTWLKNNYRLKATSLMVNWWTYWQNCFVMEDTSLRCVWYNGNWAIWLWTNVNNHYFPQRVLLKWVKKVYSNNLNTYALMTNGEMYAIWWYNVYWELWLWHASTVYFPQKIPWLSNVIDFVTAWWYYTDWVTGRWAAQSCALLQDKTVKCWWRNWTGQLWVWDGSHRYSPTLVTWLTNVKKIVMTDWQPRTTTCALLEDWSVRCWWYNWRWSLWNWDTNERNYPITTGIENVVDIEAAWTYQSWAHICAILQDKTVKCWWRNWHGQLWNWNTSNQYVPVSVIWLTNVRKIVMSWWSWRANYAITYDNKVYSWGYNWYWELWVWDSTNRSTATLINGLNNVKDIVSTWWNENSTCALIEDWTVKCWGYNAWWQLWIWDASNRNSPQTVLGLDNVVEIQIYTTYRSNRIFTCALISDWTVKCWGYNWFGQLWQLNTTDYYVPVVVKNLNKD